MSELTASLYLGSISARLDALDASIREQRRQAIRGMIFLLVTDPFDREDAIQGAHDSGLMVASPETFAEDLIAAITRWLPTEVSNG